MKKSEPKARVRKRAFRLEWEERSGGDGTLYLDGVLSFGEFAEKRKRFLTGVGVVSVFGERLSVLTFRSGCVGVSGRILGVSLDSDVIPEDRNGAAD